MRKIRDKEKYQKMRENMSKNHADVSGKNNPMWGRKNKWGHHTQEAKEKIKKSNIGKKVSLETGEKIRKWHIGKHHTEETKKKMSLMRKGKKYPIEIYPNRGSRGFILPLQDSSIEIKVQNFLKELGIEFFTHYWMNDIKHRYRCDILIPKQDGIERKTIIECDGNYWHGNQEFYSDKELNEKIFKQKEIDKIRTKELIECGYRVIRFWEHEIKNMELNDFKNKITNLQSKKYNI